MKVAMWLVLVALAAPAALADEIYKTYDEDGNPVYTDRKPADDAEPVDLPELQVLEAGDAPELAEPAGPDEAETLRVDFESPAPDQLIQDDDHSVPVELSVNLEVPGTVLVVLYLDDQPLPPFQGLATEIEDVPAGEHTLRAELQTETGRVLASSEPVTFRVAGDPDADAGAD